MEKRRNEVVVLGGASMDQMFYQLEDGRYTETAQITVPGGKGANQAVAIARAGTSVGLICNVGDDFVGAGIIDTLSNEGVDVSMVNKVRSVASDSAIIKISHADKDNDISRVGGAINSFTTALVDDNKDALLNAKVVVSQFKAPKEVIERLIDFCYKNHKFLVLTPCRPQRLKVSEPENVKLIEKIGMIFCNEAECKTIFDSEDLEACVSKYPCKLVVTLGPKGLIYHDGEKVVRMPAIQTDVKDTTGAGDTLCGNFVAAYCQGMSTEDALKRAICAATLKIQHESAQAGMPTKAELDDFVETIRVSARVNEILSKNNMDTIKFFA